MNLYLCYVAAATLLTISVALDVEKTVKQVQNILQANEGLPRLSRDEIIQLLNDIRAEDARSKSSSIETSTETKISSPNIEENEINPKPILPSLIYQSVKITTPASTPSTTFKTSTEKGGPSVMVVLPYTPRDGSSLQELYTRPPRTKVVPVSNVTPDPLVDSLEKLHRTLQNNAKSPENPKDDFPAELQAFLAAHGLKGSPGQDNFLLPLDGFKPLPPAKVIDGTVQLPENILLTYDLISDSNAQPRPTKVSPNNFLYEPLRPEYPFELETSQSETKNTIMPFDLPVRDTKSTSKGPNYEPIDYDAVRVIPLKQGISPIEESKTNTVADQAKRQTEDITTNTTQIPESESSVTTTLEVDTKSVSSNAPTADSAVADSGASIADLEDSFGGAAPEQPGDSELPPPRKNGFYWMVDWNSFLEVGDGDTKVNIRFEPKLGDPQMFIPVNVP